MKDTGEKVRRKRHTITCVCVFIRVMGASEDALPVMMNVPYFSQDNISGPIDEEYRREEASSMQYVEKDNGGAPDEKEFRHRDLNPGLMGESHVS